MCRVFDFFLLAYEKYTGIAALKGGQLACMGAQRSEQVLQKTCDF